MPFVDSHVIPGLRSRGVVVVDLRASLPRNTQWPQLRQWSTRPLAAIQLFVHHYPAVDRPALPYDEVGRIFAYARGHINADWGNGYHAPTITYHTVTGGSGTLYLCNDWESVTWHATDANGIALGFLTDVGQFQELTPEQLKTNEILADFASDACPELPADQWDHWGHGELTQYSNWTACPGPVLPFIQTYRQIGDLVRKQLEDPDMTPEERTILDAAARQTEAGNTIRHGGDLDWWLGTWHQLAGDKESLAQLLTKAQAERDTYMVKVGELEQALANATQPVTSRIARIHNIVIREDGSTEEFQALPL